MSKEEKREKVLRCGMRVLGMLVGFMFLEIFIILAAFMWQTQLLRFLMMVGLVPMVASLLIYLSWLDDARIELGLKKKGR